MESLTQGKNNTVRGAEAAVAVAVILAVSSQNIVSINHVEPTKYVTGSVYQSNRLQTMSTAQMQTETQRWRNTSGP